MHPPVNMYTYTERSKTILDGGVASRSSKLITWNSKLCCPVSGSRCFVTLYPGLPIFTNRLMSTRGFSGAGCAGASLASLAALCALYPPNRIQHQCIILQLNIRHGSTAGHKVHRKIRAK